MSGFKLSTLFSNQRGFSVTEIMVGGGILAGVALASAQMFKDQKSAQRKVDSEQKLSMYHQALAKDLGNSANCNATMKAAGFVGGTINSGALPRLAKCVGNCDEKTHMNARINDATKTIAQKVDHKAADVVIDANTDIVKMGSSDFTDNTNVWQVSRVAVKTARSTTGPVVLRVDYNMNPKLNGGSVKTVSKDIILNARFQGGAFQECVNSQESNVNNLQSDFCKTLNYGNVSSSGNSGQLATWDEASQKCVIGTDKLCTSQGLMVDGIDSNGLVKCRAITTEKTTDALSSVTPSNPCSSGQRAVMQYDTATKKFKVVCQ